MPLMVVPIFIRFMSGGNLTFLCWTFRVIGVVYVLYLFYIKVYEIKSANLEILMRKGL